MQVSQGQVVRIPLDKLVVDPMNVRVDVGDVSRLIDSIREVGLLEPLKVRPLKNGTYGVINGTRRLHALRSLGWKDAPCVVVNVDDRTALKMSYDENETHQSLSDADRKSAYRKAYELGKSLRKAAEILGVSHEQIRQVLEVSEAMEELEALEGLKIVDMRRVNPADAPKHAVGKTVAKKLAKMLKRGAEKPEEGRGEDHAVVEIRDSANLQVIAAKLAWQPKIFRLTAEGKPLHEMLQTPEAMIAIPDRRIVGMSAEPVSVDAGPFPGFYPAVKLNPPFENVRVLLCPLCHSPLRSLTRGAPVMCWECGFPNHDRVKPEKAET